MPSVKRRVKRETRVAEVREGRLKATEPDWTWQSKTWCGCSPSLRPLCRSAPMGEIAARKGEIGGNSCQVPPTQVVGL